MKDGCQLHKNTQIKASTEVYVISGAKVLMLKRGNHTEVFPDYWVGPGGHVDINEDMLTAAIREVQEETDIKINSKHIKLKAVGIHNRSDLNTTWVCTFFIAKISVINKTHETIEGKAEWLEISKVLKMRKIFPTSKYYLNHILLDKPGILYTNIECDSKGIKRIISSHLEKGY